MKRLTIIFALCATTATAGNPAPPWMEPPITAPITRPTPPCDVLATDPASQRQFPSKWLVCEKRGGGEKPKRKPKPCGVFEQPGETPRFVDCLGRPLKLAEFLKRRG